MKLLSIKDSNMKILFILLVVSREVIACNYIPEVNNAAESTKLNSHFILSIIRAESNYDCNAVSSKGAKGLMQLMDSTSKIYLVANPFDPKENISAGSKLISKLIRKYSNVDIALAAYNAGEGAVSKYDGVPPYKETINYIKTIKSEFLKKTGVELNIKTALNINTEMKQEEKSNSPWNRFAYVSPWKKHSL